MKHSIEKQKTPLTDEEKKKSTRILIICGVVLVVSIIVLTVSLISMNTAGGCIGSCGA